MNEQSFKLSVSPRPIKGDSAVQALSPDIAPVTWRAVSPSWRALRGLLTGASLYVILSASACNLVTSEFALSPEGIGNMDPALAGTWQGIGYYPDSFFGPLEDTSERINFYFAPTLDGGRAMMTRANADNFHWAAVAVSTTEIGEAHYASLRILAADDNAPAWSGYLLVRYEMRYPGVMDLFFLTEENGKEPDEMVKEANLEGDERTPETGTEALRAALALPAGEGRFDGYFGTFTRLEDVPKRWIPAPDDEEQETEPDTSTDSHTDKETDNEQD